MKEIGYRTLSVRASEDMIAALEREADRERRTKSSLARLVIEDWLKTRTAADGARAA